MTCPAEVYAENIEREGIEPTRLRCVIWMGIRRQSTQINRPLRPLRLGRTWPKSLSGLTQATRLFVSPLKTVSAEHQQRDPGVSGPKATADPISHQPLRVRIDQPFMLPTRDTLTSEPH
jgi:hypothetical protein